MRIGLFKTTEPNWKICLEHSLWGADKNYFKKWKKGDFMIMYTNEGIAGLAKCKGELYIADKNLWPKRLYQWRFPFDLVKEIKYNRLSHKKAIFALLTAALGQALSNEGVNHTLFEGDVVKKVLKELAVTDEELNKN